MEHENTPRPPVRKPPWLSKADWEALLRKYNGVPRCEVTGETTDLSVDHIVSRHKGGTDDVSNLQFLASRINAIKGTRPDSYWSQSTFYWDKRPTLEGFRTAQRELFETIVTEPWFHRPISQISRQLYLNAWVVGAGKTLGIAAAAWAVNQVIQKQWGSSRRADRILVVTKEKAVRDQLANDLKRNLVDYGIVSTAPKVAVIDKGSQFNHLDWLDSHDVVVTCVQMLWERGESSDETDTGVAATLARFPVIAFDEPHFGPAQVRRLVDLAALSLCFGFTGSPVDRDGKLLEKMVALKVYDYDAAVTHDRSLRWLDNREDLFDKFVTVLDIEVAGIIERGVKGTTTAANKTGYDHNIIPKMSVVKEVVAKTRVRDQLIMSREKLAAHRLGQPDVMMGVTYPAHPMIVCDDVATAITLCNNQNEIFAQNPEEFPPSQGWRAEVVHANGEGIKGVKGQRGSKPLTNEHAWLRAKNNNYQLDDQCARLLFVVGMAREGVNNPACGPIGVACKLTSVVEWVQRAIGRQLRAVTQQNDGFLQVPPEPLDLVQIVTHASFENDLSIRQAFDFVCDMKKHLEALPTLAALENQDPTMLDVQSRDFLLTRAEKIDIAGRLGEANEDGQLPTIDCVIGQFVGDDGSRQGPKAQHAKEWAKKVTEDPAAARRELRLQPNELSPRLIVTREHLKDAPSDADLERHLTIHQPELVEGYVPISDKDRLVITALYRAHNKRFHLPPLQSDIDVDVDTIRKGIAGKVIETLGHHYKNEKEQPIHMHVAWAVQQTLGTRDVVGKKSNWDTPQVHAMLRRSDVQSDIVGWVIDRLIDKGLCPSLATFLGRR